mmetsp:Transcript_11260/g.16949  ORF Transcript_11260/g.16949 Transcript_11260/m.16949 type:complete len:263 (-) Transcript_11260:1053-1841(-)
MHFLARCYQQQLSSKECHLPVSSHSFLGLEGLQLSLKVQLYLESLQQRPSFFCMLHLQQFNLLLVSDFYQFEFVGILRFNSFLYSGSDILGVFSITLEILSVLDEGLFLLCVPLDLLVLNLGTEQGGNDLLNPLAVSVVVHVVKGCLLKLVFGVESFGEGIDKEKQHFIRNIMFACQVNGQASLDISASCCKRVGFKHGLGQVVRSSKDNGCMKGKGTEPQCCTLLFALSNNPCRAVLLEVLAITANHRQSVFPLACFECLE